MPRQYVKWIRVPAEKVEYGPVSLGIGFDFSSSCKLDGDVSFSRSLVQGCGGSGKL
jgi:hypothetical protein